MVSVAKVAFSVLAMMNVITGTVEHDFFTDLGIKSDVGYTPGFTTGNS